MHSPKKNGSKTLILLLLAFIIPVAAAKLVLSLNLYQGGSTNTGELFATNIGYASLSMANPKPHEWQLLYLLPKQCDIVCQDRLYILQQSHIALGREQDRVHTIIMLRSDSDPAALTEFQFETSVANDELAKLLEQQALIIVDPLGSLVMRYGQTVGREKQIMQGKALVSDLRKLLKLSRIG